MVKEHARSDGVSRTLARSRAHTQTLSKPVSTAPGPRDRLSVSQSVTRSLILLSGFPFEIQKMLMRRSHCRASTNPQQWPTQPLLCIDFPCNAFALNLVWYSLVQKTIFPLLLSAVAQNTNQIVVQISSLEKDLRISM